MTKLPPIGGKPQGSRAPYRASAVNRKGRWSHRDLHELEATYGTRDDRTIARALGRPVAVIREKARAIFSAKPMRQGQPWTPEEDRRLKQCLGIGSPSVLALVLRRDRAEIDARLRELFDSIQGGPWSPDEIRMLKSMFGRREDRVLSVVLSHTIAEIQEQARQLRLAKDKAFLSRLVKQAEPWAHVEGDPDGSLPAGTLGAGEVQPVPRRTTMKRWTDEDVAILRERYPNEFNVKLAEQLDKSAKAIMSKANALKLKKSAEFLQRMGKENVRIRYRVRRAPRDRKA